jgi:hypothetical protein
VEKLKAYLSWRFVDDKKKNEELAGECVGMWCMWTNARAYSEVLDWRSAIRRLHSIADLQIYSMREKNFPCVSFSWERHWEVCGNGEALKHLRHDKGMPRCNVLSG